MLSSVNSVLNSVFVLRSQIHKCCTHTHTQSHYGGTHICLDRGTHWDVELSLYICTEPRDSILCNSHA